MVVISAEFSIEYGPPETVERYTLYPETADVLAAQFRVTECAIAWTPVPVSVMVEGEFVALLLTVAVPGNVPVPRAQKSHCGLRSHSWFSRPIQFASRGGRRWTQLLRPREMLTLEMVTSEFPALVNVTPKVLVPPMLTPAKPRVVVLGLRRDVAAVTVRVAALLVTLPVPFVIVTVSCALLSETVSAGVVYDAVVAPPMAVPFFFH